MAESRYSGNYAKKAYEEAYEAEHHLHNRELWFGPAAAASATHFGDIDNMSSYQIDAGTDDFGAWVQLLGTNDTPNQSAKHQYDAHRLVIAGVETDKIATRIQLAAGASGSQVVQTEVFFFPAKIATQVDSPLELICPLIDSKEELWARCWVKGIDTSTIDFNFGIHEYFWS